MTIEKRIDRLERQNRWLKGGLGLLLLTIVAGALLGLAEQRQTAERIRTRHIAVVNDEGEDAVCIGGTETGGYITVLGDGVDQLITLSAMTGESKIEIRAPSKGAGKFSESRGCNRRLVRLGSHAGSNKFVLYDARGGWIEMVAGEELNWLSFSSWRGEDSISLTTNSDRIGSIRLNDNVPKCGRVLLGGAKNGSGWVETENSEGRSLVQLGMTKDGRGVVSAFDPSDKRKPSELAPE